MGRTFSKKAFYLLVPPKQMLFLTIANENNFFKTQITRLGARVAPNKGLEQGLPSIYESVNPCHAIVLFIYSLRGYKNETLV